MNKQQKSAVYGDGAIAGAVNEVDLENREPSARSAVVADNQIER